jgi:hypothetical protein
MCRQFPLKLTFVVGILLCLTACTAPSTTEDDCSLGTERMALPADCYFQTHTPLDFLQELQEHPDQPVTLLEVPVDWIQKEDIGELMKIIDSKEPAAPVVAAISSYYPFEERSTVGNEALFLIEGYRQWNYPPGLCSVYGFQPNASEVRLWWEATKGSESVTEEQAVAVLQSRYPEFREYPSDNLPPRSIRTENAADGVYVAFVQEGSGVPIISAQCFLVHDNRTIEKTGVYGTAYNITFPSEFKVERCG